MWFEKSFKARRLIIIFHWRHKVSIQLLLPILYYSLICQDSKLFDAKKVYYQPGVTPFPEPSG